MHQGLSPGMPLMTRGSSSPRGTDFWSSRTEINGRTERHAIFGAKGLSNAVKKCVISDRLSAERNDDGAAQLVGGRL
jgi:hypothetical protein